MQHEKVWVVVADGARARILSADPRARRLTSLEELASEEARRKTSESVSDRQGRAFESASPGHRSAMEPATDPQRHAQAEFARRVADVLARAAQEGRFDALHLVAAPRALGDLRAVLAPEVLKRVVRELDKDLVGLTVPQLEEHLWPETAGGGK
jgi:protein required for attachment to host cells